MTQQNPLSAKAEPEWDRKPSDGSYCLQCGEVIIGNMVQLIVFIEYEPIETKFKYCESCKPEE